MKLSIIVPVYKVEAFLDKCIESILSQTFQDYELILVDDGSPDSCGLMCDTWAKKDSRIKVIHKKNGGLSDARNAGLDIAKGEYIGFVDSDDYIRRDMFEVLIRNLEHNNADISMCGFADVYDNGLTRESSNQTVYVWNQKEAIFHILIGRGLSVHAYTKLYKRYLFEEVRYPVGKISEDAFVIMDIMDKVQTAVFTPYSLYYYVHRSDSINTSKFTTRDLTRIEAHKKNYDYILNEMPEYKQIAYERYLGAVAFVAGKAAMFPETENIDCVRPLFKELKHNLAKIYSGRYFRLRRKVLITILVFNKALYRYIYKTTKRLV